MLYLPQLAFSLTAPEQALLTPELVAPRRKNISYQPDTRTLRGVADKQKTAAIARLMARYHQMTHPHPSFTPDESAILFSSDKDGKPAIYIAKLPEHPPMLSA